MKEQFRDFPQGSEEERQAVERAKSKSKDIKKRVSGSRPKVSENECMMIIWNRFQTLKKMGEN